MMVGNFTFIFMLMTTWSFTYGKNRIA